MQKLTELLAEQNSLSFGFSPEHLFRFEAPGSFFAIIAIFTIASIFQTR